MPEPDLPAAALFDGLAECERREVAALASRVRVRPGASLVGLGQPGDAVYVVVTGTLRVQAEQEDGSLVLLAFLGPGDLVGEMSLLDRDVRSASVIAVEACSALWFDREVFERFLERMPRLALNVLRAMSRRLRLADARIQSLSTQDVAGRVARELAALSSAYGVRAADGSMTIPLRLTQVDVADLVGASRERVNHAMVEMRERGLISTDASHRITVHDREALTRRYA